MVFYNFEMIIKMMVVMMTISYICIEFYSLLRIYKLFFLMLILILRGMLSREYYYFIDRKIEVYRDSMFCVKLILGKWWS